MIGSPYPPASLLKWADEQLDAYEKDKKESTLARKSEKGTLDSKTAATFGVTEAPDLLMWLPADEKPTVLGRTASGGKFAYQVKTYNKAAKQAAPAK